MLGLLIVVAAMVLAAASNWSRKPIALLSTAVILLCIGWLVFANVPTVPFRIR